jgi:hypothetical protein
MTGAVFILRSKSHFANAIFLSKDQQKMSRSHALRDASLRLAPQDEVVFLNMVTMLDHTI